MPSALEKLYKVLKLESETGYKDHAVYRGLAAFAKQWEADARAQAKKPEHHLLIDELVQLMQQYSQQTPPEERPSAVRYMIGRITGRVPRASSLATAPSEPPSARGVQTHLDDHLPESARREPTPLDLDSPSGETTFGATPTVSTTPPAAPSLPPRRRRLSPDPQREAAFWRTLQQPVTVVNGVGEKVAEKLAALGIRTLEDWLWRFPRRYDDFSTMLPLNRLRPNMIVTAAGTVREVKLNRAKRGTEVLHVTIHDGTGSLTATFFNQPYLEKRFERGMMVVFSGKITLYQQRLIMNNPEWEPLDKEALHTRAIVPIYPLTKDLSQGLMRKLSRKVVDRYALDVPDYLPEPILDRVGLPDLGWAIKQLHFPDSQEALRQAKRRIAFDDLLLLQLGVLRNRLAWQSQRAEPLLVSDETFNALINGLPYQLTNAQQRALAEIRRDLARDVPMNRLLQGDVGAGKTVVAALGMAIALLNGAQAALMAPTSILAEQHRKNLARLFSTFASLSSYPVYLLTGDTPASTRAEILSALANGEPCLVVGTHALISENVNFARLGMAVIDEQHRFGVEQRGALRGKGTNPHVLVMTATPIPRTLALTLFADLDLSVLDELPPNRTPVDTRVIRRRDREALYAFIDRQVKQGRQAFIVCPLVDSDAENAEQKAAVAEYEYLQREIFPERRLGLLHGKLSARQKEAVMSAFSRGELDILVTTAVVEVGVDVPNATVILIEGANRFGLAQLHQFRGRVGRGTHKSYCLLLPDDDNADNARLQAMESTADGFKLAELDWQQRGAGELLGTRQSGKNLIMSAAIDPKLVAEAQLEARTLYEEDPMLRLPEHAALRSRLEARYGRPETAEFS
ncbi:MAG: ATP-dependent DNA helicase RecG [Anaerolineae bacterium]|nr:ATP-dependent DNA helicase RecG [Anaerolineae bacterium]